MWRWSVLRAGSQRVWVSGFRRTGRKCASASVVTRIWIRVQGMAPRLKERYRADVLPALMKEFSYRNVMEAPRVEKVTVNIGLGEAVQNAKALDSGSLDIATITGQQPVIRLAKQP